MQIFFRKSSIFPILLFILIIPLFYQLIRPGFFPMQDDLQAFRVHQMVKCLKDFQIPCRWIPDMGFQYGYPQFNFYPPSVFYLGGLLNLLGIQIIDTVKILFILGFVLSAITMFILLKSIFGEFSALVGSILYSFVPYKAQEVYVRGSLSEFFAFVFFPLIFWSTYQLIKLGKLKYIVWLALSIGFLLTTHNLMSFIFLPIFGIWVVALNVVYKKWGVFPKVFLGSLLGLGLASFFTLPVIFESKYAHLETLTGGYFDYRQHFVDLKQLFLSNHFGYGSSYLGPNDDLSLSAGIIHWIVGLLAVILAILFFKKNRKLASLVIILGVEELIVLFLMHQRSVLIWESILQLKWLQFPWRFLSDSAFLLSILGAFAIHMTSNFNKKFALIFGIIIIVSIYLLHVSFFQPKAWLEISDEVKFSGESWEKQLTISIFDYLPTFAKLPPNKKAPDLPEVLDGEVEFVTYKKGSNFQVGEIEVLKDATIRLPLFDFPGMKVKVDEVETLHANDDCRNQQYCLGLITFNVPIGKHSLEAKLYDTPIRQAGNIITIISIFILITLFLLGKKYEKNLK